MNKDVFVNSPKQFCENVSVAHTNESFAMVLLSGQNAQVYAFTPQHMKRLGQYIQKQVEQFEEKNGEIKAKWEPGIVSPMQPSSPDESSGGN